MRTAMAGGPQVGVWDAWLRAEAARREQAGLRRTLSPRDPDEATLDLAGNDYLGLSRHPAVVEAAVAATRRWGTGAGASRLVTGSLRLHADLEAALAELTGWPAALVTSTGYHANLSVVSALADRDTLVVSDAHVHASLVDATRLARADVAVVPHLDVDAVEAALGRAAGTGRPTRALVLTESVFSVLGDPAPLTELAAVCERYGALLVVDEAHGLGVAGAGGGGLVRERGLAGHPNVVVTVTLSKALGAQGGAVLGSPPLVEHLVNRARPFVFDTGLAPAPTAAALAAVGVLEAEPSRPATVAERVATLAGRLGLPTPAGAVLSTAMPSPGAAVAAQATARERGVRVGCFRPPSVPDGVSRLRVTVNAGIAEPAWSRATDVVVGVVREASG